MVIFLREASSTFSTQKNAFIKFLTQKFCLLNRDCRITPSTKICLSLLILFETNRNFFKKLKNLFSKKSLMLPRCIKKPERDATHSTRSFHVSRSYSSSFRITFYFSFSFYKKKDC